MKKVIAFLMAAVMATALFAGCSKGAASSAAAAAEKAETAYSDVGGESAYPEASALTKHKIGVLWYGWTDQLSTSIKKNMDYIGTQFNCEMVYGEALTAEAAISATENLIQAGCEGIISLFVYADMVEQCNKAGVYLAQFCNGTTDAELLASEKASDYFVGIVNENDQACGAAMVDDLYERGCRNIVWLAPAAGMSTNHDNRVRGIEEALKKYSDLNVLSSYRGDDSPAAMETYAVTYPDMDGIILTGGAGGGTESFYQVMTSEGLSERGVIFATIDIGEGTGDRLKAGDLGWIAGGQFPTSGIAFTLVYNAIEGNKIMEDPTVVVDREFMVLQSYEDYENYVKYVAGDIPPYTGDELKALIVSMNDGMTADSAKTLYKEYSDAYGIDDVVARHAALFD